MLAEDIWNSALKAWHASLSKPQNLRIFEHRNAQTINLPITSPFNEWEDIRVPQKVTTFVAERLYLSSYSDGVSKGKASAN